MVFRKRISAGGSVVPVTALLWDFKKQDGRQCHTRISTVNVTSFKQRCLGKVFYSIGCTHKASPLAYCIT